MGWGNVDRSKEWVDFPDGIVRVEYLESTGTQWIDTGVPYDSTVVVECDVSNTSNTVGGGYFFGILWASGESSTIRRWAIGFDGSRQKFSTQYYTTISASNPVVLQNYVRHSVRADSNTLKVDSTSATVTSSTFNPTTDVSIYIFARHTYAPQLDPNPVTSPQSFRLYSFKVTKGGALVRDMIPVRVGSDSAMYDKVSKQLFRNQGTGSFLYGPDTIVSKPVIRLHRQGWDNPYVTNGLVAMWDGVWNAGGGVHYANATTWKDLVGQNDMTCGYSFDANSVVCTGYNSCYVPSGVNTITYSDVVTVEACFNISTVFTNMMYARFLSDNRIIALAVQSRGGISLWSNKGGFGPLTSGFHCFSINYGSSDIDKFYKDGQLVEKLTEIDGWYTPGYPIWIGAKNTSTRGFIGNWHSLRIYNRTLTAAEIAANYAIDKSRFNLP